MNRAEKRRMDRTEIWFNSLSEDKKKIITDTINDKINSNNNMMTAISDICTVGALDDVLDIDIATIRAVMSKTKSYLIEYGEYLEREENGGIDMIENQEIRSKVKDRIREFIKGKMDKARGLKLLKKEFNLPNAELSDLWLECKNVSCDRNMDKVPENTNDRPTDEDVVKFGNDVLGTNIATKEAENVEITQIEKKNSLKVIRVTTEVEGEYGTYIKTVDGVKINDRLYSDIDMVKKEKIKLAAEYNTKIDSVMEKIRALNAEMKEIQDIGMKEIERFTEIESVFGL
jgi:uncharacterized protein YoxC